MKTGTWILLGLGGLLLLWLLFRPRPATYAPAYATGNPFVNLGGLLGGFLGGATKGGGTPQAGPSRYEYIGSSYADASQSGGGTAGLQAFYNSPDMGTDVVFTN